MALLGDPSRFAIEYQLSKASNEQPWLASGYFCLYIGSFRYGVVEEFVELLNCVYNGICERISRAGTHRVDLDGGTPGPVEIATLFEQTCALDHGPFPIYGYDDPLELNYAFLKAEVEWNRWCGACFDDGSRILQLDEDDDVLLIGHKTKHELPSLYVPDTFRYVRIPAVEFYALLDAWCVAYREDWERMPKDTKFLYTPEEFHSL